MVDALIIRCIHCGEPNLVPLTEDARRATHADVRFGAIPQEHWVGGEGSHYEGSFDPNQTEAFSETSSAQIAAPPQRAFQFVDHNEEPGG